MDQDDITKDERFIKAFYKVKRVARETYITVLVQTYCAKCKLNCGGICKQYGLPIEEAIAIVKKVDEVNEEKNTIKPSGV